MNIYMKIICTLLTVSIGITGIIGGPYGSYILIRDDNDYLPSFFGIILFSLGMMFPFFVKMIWSGK